MEDIGDITYLRGGKVRIPFSMMEEYCADNRANGK